MVLATLLTGCYTSSKVSTETIPQAFMVGSENEVILPVEDVLFHTMRQSVIISQETVGILDGNSIFAIPVFMMEGEHRLSNIYRTVYPWCNNENVFEALCRELVAERQGSATLSVPYANDILLSFLLTEDSIYLSDDDLLEQLSNITRSYVFSKHMDSMNYRLIAINHFTGGAYIFEASWSYFVQVWDNDYIWAQPLIEGTEIIFEQASFVTSSETNKFLILAGYTRMPNGTGLASIGTGFMFEDGIWTPIAWNEVFEVVTPMEHVGTSWSDGIRATIFPEWIFPEEPHTHPRFTFRLMDDASFWANHIVDDGLEIREHLFRLK